MADAVDTPGAIALPASPRAELRRTAERMLDRGSRFSGDLALAISGLVGAMLALPLAQSTWHGPEVAAVLAVSAVALFAGQRWAIALIVIGELFLLPTVWPRAFFAGDLTTRLVALATLAAIVPGVLAMRRAATVLVVMSGRRRTQLACRRVHVALVAVCVLAVAAPLL
ncbi:MAG TPA: hypothetical protein VFP84_20385 [Kofleriaceae bacterium]|nr:hypothetical protein [Kofleriaceae bacterium]